MKTQDRRTLAELAPFYVAGTLQDNERADFERALAEDADLARNVAAARAERAEVVALNEGAPAPGVRATAKLFALIDAEPQPAPGLWRRLDLGARLAEFFSPRALGWVAAAACLLVAVEAGFLAKPAPVGSYATASRDEAASEGRFALVGFNPDARADQIADLLAQNGAQIVGGPRAGFFQVKLGDKAMSEAQAAAKLESLKASGLVRSALKKGEP